MTASIKEYSLFVIDDAREIRSTLKFALEKAGYRVTLANNGVEAIEKLKAGEVKPDLILCDIMMPHMDGYDVFHQLHQDPRFIKIPFIFLTAKSHVEEVRRGKELGVEDYISKPFVIRDLLAAVRGTLKRTQEVKQAYSYEQGQLQIDQLNHLMQQSKTALSIIHEWAVSLATGNVSFSPDELQYLGRQMKRSSEFLDQLLSQFIFMQQLEFMIARQKHQKKKKTIPLGEILIREINIAKASTERQFEFISDFEDDLEINTIIPHYFDELFHNLLENAVMYTLDGGRITTRAYWLDNKICVEIQDTGIGIPENALNLIFEKFYQVERSQYDLEQQGTGLGLSIVKTIIDYHHGEIHVASLVGQGSKFTVILPISSIT